LNIDRHMEGFLIKHQQCARDADNFIVLSISDKGHLAQAEHHESNTSGFAALRPLWQKHESSPDRTSIATLNRYDSTYFAPKPLSSQRENAKAPRYTPIKHLGGYRFGVNLPQTAGIEWHEVTKDERVGGKAIGKVLPLLRS